MDVTKIALSDEQREAILTFKKYRQENNIKISGQEIYEMVIKNGITKVSPGSIPPPGGVQYPFSAA